MEGKPQEEDLERQGQKQLERQAQKQSLQQGGKWYTPRRHPLGKKRLRVNTSHSRGELRLLKAIIARNQWVEVFKEGDVLWSGLALPLQQLHLATEILVNRLPEMPHICHKRTLGAILNRFRSYWPADFQFYPRTYLLPQNQTQVEKELVHGAVMIAKPSAGCQGDGIVLIRRLNDIPTIGNNQWIVQPYIDKPLLMERRKFDLRLYVLISSLQPYLCYLNEEGLARFCSEDYEAPTKENFSNAYIHLTNYSLNKNHPKFQHGKDIFSKGNKRCLRVVWEELQQNGVDVTLLRSRIDELLKKFLIGIYPFLKYYYRATFPKERGKCFHVVGVDVLIDSQLRPWLLEANNNPSFNVQHQPYTPPGTPPFKELSPVDQYVKTLVVQDALYLTRRSLEKQKNMQIGEHYYSYIKILDANSEDMTQLKMVEDALKLFHSQCGVRSKSVLTSSQFCKLATLPHMTNQRLTKNDYHLLFVRVMRHKFNTNQMEFEDFLDALEQLVSLLTPMDPNNKLPAMESFLTRLSPYIE